ncbi:MAG: PDZ domain-containing protein [Phycisphaerales bacterium JB050]
MIKTIHTGLFPLAAASLLAFSGLAVAQQAPTPKQTKVETETKTVSVQTTTLSDGKNIVEVRVVDGQVFVKVNGEQRSTRTLNGDWEKFEVRSEDGEKVIATVLKNGEANGVMVLSGAATEDEVKEYKQRLAEVRPRGGTWVGRFPALKNADELDELEELELFLSKDLEGLVEELGDFEFDEEIAADLLRNFEFSIASEPGLPSALRFESGLQPKSMIGITMNIESTEDGEQVIVEEIMEGLPASKAGLKPGDRIIEIEEIGEATGDSIRRITREYEPGQEVKIRILRDGDEIEKVITLAPYRSNVFGNLEEPQGISSQRFFAIEGDAKRMAEMNAAAERLRAEVSERRAQIEAIAEEMATAKNPEELVTQLRESARQLEESVRKLSEQRMREGVERGLVERLQGQSGGVIIGRGERGERPYVLTFPETIAVPGAPPMPSLPPSAGLGRNAPDAKTLERIDTVEQRLDRLEESNQRIEQMLQELMAQLAPRS